MAEFHGYIIPFLIGLASISILRAIFKALRAKPHLPPSPPSLPIVGHLHLLAPIPHQALHKLANRYGPLIHLSLGNVPCLVASTPETAKEFLKAHETSFSDRPTSFAVDFLTYGSQDFSFAPYGPYWKFMKKICMSQLLGGRTLDLLSPVRYEERKRFVELLLKKSESKVAVDIGGELVRVTNNIISRMIMRERCSEDDDEEAGEVRKLVQDSAELTGKFNVSDFIWFCKNLDLQGFRKRLKEVRDRFDDMMERIIKQHEEVRKKKMMEKENCDASDHDSVKDLLDILLDISEDKSSEIRLTRENIKAFILVRS